MKLASLFAQKFFYYLFFALCTLYIVGLIFQASSALTVGISLSNIPALGFLCLSFFVLLILWLTFFMRKTPLRVLFLLCFLWGYVWLSANVPILKKNLEFNDCLETGVCEEGVEVNTKSGSIVITKESCAKINRYWNKMDRTCNLRFLPK